MRTRKNSEKIPPLECWEAICFVEEIKDGTPVKAFIQKPTGSSYQLDFVTVEIDKLDDLGLKVELFNDDNSSNDIKNGDMLLLITFTHDSETCTSSVREEKTTRLLTFSKGQPFYLATRINGKGKKYKRRTEAIVTPNDPATLVNVKLV